MATHFRVLLLLMHPSGHCTLLIQTPDCTAPFRPLTAAQHSSVHSLHAAPHIRPLSDAHNLADCTGGHHHPKAARVIPRSVDMPLGAHQPSDLSGVDPSGVEPSAAGVGGPSDEEERDCWHEVVIKAMVHPVDGR